MTYAEYLAAEAHIVLVEVLSDGTEAGDRFEKFAHYHRIPSLREYVLVGQHSPRIEVYRREGAEWILTEAGPGGAGASQFNRVPDLGR